MVMKKFFDKDAFILSSFDAKQKRQSWFVSIAIMVFFIFTSFTFLNMLYAFSDCVGSIVCASFDVAIKDLLRSLPLFFSFFMSFWTLLMLHVSFRNADDAKRVKSIFRKVIVILSFAGVNILYVLIARIAGKYTSLVEGSPSALYPLDSILYSFLYVAIGVFIIIYVKKLQEKLPYTVLSRAPIVQKVRPLYCVGMTFWMLIAFFCFASTMLGLFIIDFEHGYQFYSVMVLIAYSLTFLYLLIWEFYFNELKEEKRKEFSLVLSIAGLSVSVLVIALYFVSFGLNLDAQSNIGFGIFPVGFAASVNIATMIVVLTPFFVSLIAFIKALVWRKTK